MTKVNLELGVFPIIKEFGSSAVLPEVLKSDVSLQADRSRRRKLLQLTSRLLRERRLKGSMGTDVMPVLSQTILDKLAEDRAVFCLGVKTPMFSNQNLTVSNKEEKG